MSRFKFTCQHEAMPFMDSASSKLKVEFEAEELSDILQQFELFLKGCGYNVKHIVDDWGIREEVLPKDEKHSQYFFDFDRNKPIREDECND